MLWLSFLGNETSVNFEHVMELGQRVLSYKPEHFSDGSFIVEKCWADAAGLKKSVLSIKNLLKWSRGCGLKKANQLFI